MKIIGQTYFDGRSKEIFTFETSSTLTEGKAVSMDANQEIIAFNGVSTVGIAQQQYNAGCVSVVSSGAVAVAVTGIGSINAGEVVYLQADGTFGTTASDFGAYTVISGKETMVNLANEEVEGCVILFDGKQAQASAPVVPPKTQKKEVNDEL